jgi:hypothetical protein
MKLLVGFHVWKTCPTMGNPAFPIELDLLRACALEDSHNRLWCLVLATPRTSSTEKEKVSWQCHS